MCPVWERLPCKTMTVLPHSESACFSTTTYNLLPSSIYKYLNLAYLFVYIVLCLYPFGVNTQTELNTVKRKSEKTERELSNSRTRNQQLATRNEEVTVS